MALKLTRSMTAGAVGALSGATNGGFVEPLKFGPTTNPTKIQWSTVVEGIAAVGGMAMQMFMPMTMMNVVDGAVDAGIALLAKRGVENVMSTPEKPAIAPFASPRMLGSGQMNPMVGAGMSQAAMRAQLGSTGTRTKNTLY